MIHPGEIGVCQTPSAVSRNLSSALIKNEDCIEDQDSQRRIYLLSLLLQRFLHPIFASAQVSYLMRPRRKFLKAGAVPCAVHFMWPRHQQVWIRATEDRRALTTLAQLQLRGDPSGWCRRAAPKARGMSQFILRPRPVSKLILPKLDDGWPESEKDVFQAALRMVVVKDSRSIVGEFNMGVK